MLNESVVPEMMELYDYNIFEEILFPQSKWFQDGAPAHGTLEVRNRLAELFGANNVIALHHNNEWPARSPDLTPYDFFCGDTLNGKFFNHLHLIFFNSGNELYTSLIC